ncbi:MAG: hypothetical protein KDE28_17080, partial [Anaerolineales bacterium]|nr:hypothetical protein [Anaerolineales bacterium]
GAARIGNKTGLGSTAAVVNQGLILAEVPGQTIFVSPTGSFANQGTLQVAGGTLDVSKLTGTPGTVQFTGVGQLALNGTFSLDQPLAPPAGAIVTLDGAYTIDQPLDILAGSTLSLLGDWHNNSAISATNATVNLGGQFTLADLGTFVRSGGTVNLVGILDNSNTTLALNAGTGNWQLNGGTILNGTVTTADSVKLTATTNINNQLTGVTLEGELDLAVSSAFLRIANGIVLNGTIRMTGVNSALHLPVGPQTISGTGTVFFEGTTCCRYVVGNLTDPLTIGPGITLRGGAARIGNKTGLGSTAAVVNQGLILAEVPGQTIFVSPTGSFTNQGTLQVDSGTIDLLNPLAVDTSSRVLVLPQGTLKMASDLLGNTTQPDLFVPTGIVRLDGTRPAGNPQLFEVMGQDLGAVEAGFANNFSYGSLSVENNTNVRLVDQVDNAVGAGAEAIYADVVTITSGSTLDLNGLHLYARRVLNSGSVIGGEVSQFAQSSPFTYGVAMSGMISLPGELDEWTFAGPAGRSINIWLNPGSGGSPVPPLPRLFWAQISLIGPDGNTLATNSSSQSGAQVTLNDYILPTTGEYRVQVRASAGHLSNTGNYLIRLLDSRFNDGVLQLNQQINGRIEPASTSDRWRFAAVAGQQIRLDLINLSSPGILFRLADPNGTILFDNLGSSSSLITLVTSGNYLLTVYSGNGQIGDYAFRLSETSQLVLTPGVSYTGALAGSGQAQIFRVDIAQASPLSIEFLDLVGQNNIELYAKLGVPPTRSDYGYRAPNPLQSRQQVMVPMAAPGVWYILLYGAAVPYVGNYQLLAEVSDVFVTEVTPAQINGSVDGELTVAGAGFVDVAAVDLISGGGTAYPTTGIVVHSPVRLTTHLTAGSVPPGVYGLRVTRTNGASNLLDQAIKIVPDGVPGFETNLVVPAVIGRGILSTLYVEYANRGDVAIPAPVLAFHGSDRVILTLDAARIVRGTFQDMPDGFSDTVQILAGGVDPGLLQPGESFRIPVYCIGLQMPWDFQDTEIDFDVSITTADDSTPVDWVVERGNARPSYIDPVTWEAIWTNLVAQVGPTWGDYVRMLGDNASYLGQLGQRDVDISRLFGFELQQANGLHVLQNLAGAVDLAVPAPGLNLDFQRVFANSILGRNQTGPLGKGWYHFWQGKLVAQPDGTMSITGPNGSQRRFQPDVRGWQRFYSQAGDYGQLTKMPDGSFQLREKDGILRHYLADGKFDYIEEPNGNRITASYTGELLTALTHSSGQSLLITYNGADLIESVTDSKGRVTHYTYDGTNEHLIAVEDYDGRITHYSYDTSGDIALQHALLTIDAPNGVQRFYDYDSRGWLTSTHLNGGAERLDFSLDSEGAFSIVDAAGKTTTIHFNQHGLPIQTVDPLGNATNSEYDDSFNLTHLTDPAGLVWRFAYDARGNLTGNTGALGQTSQFAYTGTLNRLARVQDAKANTTQFTYDTQGNPIATTHADGTAAHVTYDSLGQPLVFTNRRGSTITYSHNADSQITGKLYAGGSQVQYTYDVRGNLASTSDVHGVTTYTYDAGDRLTLVSYPGGRFLAYSYDSSGRRIQMADQDGFVVHYGYDALSRLATLTDTAGTPIITYSYDALGRLARSDLGNGAFTTYEYDAAGHVTHLLNHAPGGAINSRFDYTYDALGRRTGMATLDGAWSYSYDATGQLTHAVLDSTNPAIADQDLTYQYDALGNRVRTLENGVETQYTANNMNQYTQVGAATYTYDADGNMATRQGGPDPATFTFDDDSRLVGLSSGAGVWSYEYDALGRRIASTHDGQRTEYLLDPTGMGDVVGEYDGAGVLVARYVHGLGLAARISASDTLYYDFDALGSVVGLVGDNGNYSNAYSYLPFGQHLNAIETVSNPFIFVGRSGVMREVNGLDLMRARYYAPTEGRFINEDPIGFAGGDTNLYGYVKNKPITDIDPNGLFLECGGETAVLCDNEYNPEEEEIENWVCNRAGCRRPDIRDCLIKCRAKTGKGSEDEFYDEIERHIGCFW